MEKLKLDIQRFSGGSYDYVCYKVEQECEERMYDEELNEMIADLVKVLHDLEWWQSGDINEENYRDTVDEFKEKWFKNKLTTQQIKLNAIKRHLEDGIKIIGD